MIFLIKDPYVVHHDALGLFATDDHLPEGTDVAVACTRVAQLNGIQLVQKREHAAQSFELPAACTTDREPSVAGAGPGATFLRFRRFRYAP